MEVAFYCSLQASQDFTVIPFMNEAVLIGHGDAVKTGCEVGGLNDFTNSEDAVVKELAVIG